MADLPPPYTTTRIPPSDSFQSQKSIDVPFKIVSQNGAMNKPNQMPAPSNHSPFPQSFGFYHSSGAHSDMQIALSADDSRPLYYISTHSALSSQPSVVLHSKIYSTSAPIATAQFHSFSKSVDIEVFSSQTSQPIRTTLQREGHLHPTHFFLLSLAPGAPNEKFEWKRSSGPEVARLQGKSHGMALVRCQNGEVVAAWAPPNSGRRKKGKMSFLYRERGAELGETFEAMAVISVLALMEKRRRGQSSATAVAAGGAGAAGGGGC